MSKMPLRHLRRLSLLAVVVGVASLIIINIVITLNIYGTHRGEDNSNRRGIKSFINGEASRNVLVGDDGCKTKYCGNTESGLEIKLAVDSRLSTPGSISRNIELPETEAEKPFQTDILQNYAKIDRNKLSNSVKNGKVNRKDISQNIDSNKENTGSEEENTDCPINRLKPRFISTFMQEEVACKPHRASSEACQYAKEVYPYAKNSLTCKSDEHVEFCKFHGKGFKCVIPKNCPKVGVEGVKVENGRLELKGSFKSVAKLERGLPEILHKASASGFNFLFIGCLLPNGTLEIPQQLFTWSTPRRGQIDVKDAAKININIVLLDSVARAHFYRSLPDVIQEFENINSDKHSPGEILDFISFQAVHGHTAENAHVLFSGSLLPNNISERAREKSDVGHGNLFGKFRKAGYKTMYQDDLCWDRYWGLRIELGLPGSWKEYLKALEKAEIDDTGITASSCRILKSNNLDNPFSEAKDNQICFNGKFQHDYFFDYSSMWHRYSNQPTISYTTLNTAHDWHGTRTQTLTKGLIEHVTEMLKLENTLTILMADHGNTYTPFVRKILEGRYEMYHPSFFMVVPNSVASRLGDTTMDALRANQKRLFTMLDVNHGLHAIADLAMTSKLPEKRGIFGLIPAARTCDDLPLKLPNLCVCEGWDNDVQNDTTQLSLLEYGVGLLNNEIDRQRHAASSTTSNQGFDSKKPILGPRKCHHLVPLYYRNVRERNAGETLISSFDFVVSSGSGIDQTEELFHVETQSNIKPDVTENFIKLLSFERLSRWGPYRACADDGVDVRLCVCSLDKNPKAKNGLTYTGNASVATLWRLMPKLPGIQAKDMLYNRKSDKCIYIIARSYHGITDDNKVEKDNIQTSVLEGLNICPDQSFAVRISIEPHSMKMSTSRKFTAIVEENSLKMLCVLVTENWSWTTNYKFEYEVFPL